MEDEWLTQIYASMRDARNVIEKFAEGRPYDNERELSVTRYFGSGPDEFNRGMELEKDDPKIVSREWMRMAVYTIN